MTREQYLRATGTQIERRTDREVDLKSAFSFEIDTYVDRYGWVKTTTINFVIFAGKFPLVGWAVLEVEVFPCLVVFLQATSWLWTA